MTNFIWFYIITVGIGVACRLFLLSGNSYPRHPKPVGRGNEICIVIAHLGFMAWAWSTLL
jgi:hypothetical protein